MANDSEEMAISLKNIRDLLSPKTMTPFELDEIVEPPTVSNQSQEMFGEWTPYRWGFWKRDGEYLVCNANHLIMPRGFVATELPVIQDFDQLSPGSLSKSSSIRYLWRVKVQGAAK